jgi:16S rRNA A1518/A1519 N6-dimethyltransferase RsmA/KsgA/DIM1 with predicted DNA glycosylase/AP lyase activity
MSQIGETDINNFWQLIRHGYRSKRKFLVNNLASHVDKSKVELNKILKILKWDEKIRPENLSLNDWVALYHHLKK